MLRKNKLQLQPKMLCNGPEQELLFPICRTIRRLVDEGKPAVVSTAELFETKMKVLENVKARINRMSNPICFKRVDGKARIH